MTRLFLTLILVAGTALAADWWETASIYQIYPLSFMDSDGDGQGDIPGITSKVDYFSDILVDAVWLSPIFDSPFKDNGYDVRDFRKIHEKFGTMDQFKAMIDAFHKKGIKVLLDFVPNHTSDEHPWFQSSKQKKDGKDDYYVWRNAKGSQTQQPTPPNNWRTLFNGGMGPAWKFLAKADYMNPGRDQFYLHQFGDFQPDLNYNNSAVIVEMQNVLSFWLDLGVDGFRVDAVPYLVEDDTSKDEPQICADRSYNCLNHTFTKDQNQTYFVVQQFEETVKKAGGDKYMFVEAYTDVNHTMRFFNDRTAPFNFGLIGSLSRTSNAIDFMKVINGWMDNKPKDRPSNWVIGNHDNDRVSTRFGDDMVDVMNMLVLLLPGASVTYYGEEIGMTNYVGLKKNDTQNPVCRDPERTPFQWNNKTNAGFSSTNRTVDATWLEVNPNYVHINMESQANETNSTLGVYKKLKALRKDLADTDWQGANNISDYVLTVRRGNYFLIVNLDNKPVDVELPKMNVNAVGKLKFTTRLNNYADEYDVDFSKNITLQQRSGIVVKINGASAVVSSVTLLLVCLSAYFVH